MSTIIFFDVETTGFSSSDRIVQLAWLVHDLQGNEIKAENHIIKPDGFDIPEKATVIHGISTQEAMDGGEDLRETIVKFLDDVANCGLLVGHNVSFDVRMIEYEFLRVGIGFIGLVPKLCTMKKSTDYCAIPSKRKRYKQPKLQELHARLFGNEFEGAHNALADIQATAKCYWKLKELGIINPIIL